MKHLKELAVLLFVWKNLLKFWVLLVAYEKAHTIKR